MRKSLTLLTLLCLLFIILTTFIIVKKNIITKNLKINQNSLNKLTKIGGDRYIYNIYEDKNIKKDISFYKPISIIDISNYLPNEFYNKIKSIKNINLPFNVQKNEVIVTSTCMSGNLQYQLQASYFKNENLAIDNNEFFIVTISESKNNPLKDIKNEDYFSIQNLSEKQLLLQVKKHADINYVYSYYFYNKNNNKIQIINTGASEIYTYNEGLLYHFAYSINNSKPNSEKQIINLIKFIVFKQY